MRSITLKRDAPNTVILYATAADNTAADGVANTNSPFTKALAAEIKQPNEWAVVQRHVVNRVFKETQEQQEPKSSGNFKEEMYFNVTVNPGPAATELAFWDSIKNSTDIADFDEYKNKYPQGTFIGLANNRIRQLKANASIVSQPPVSQAATAPVIQAPPATCTDCPELVTLPSGTFQMGSNDSDSDGDEKPIHSVSIKSFAIGKYEVTQGQWKAIMGNNPSHFSSCGDTCPVEKVSWDDIQIYLQKLNQKTGQKYRLPTEAEWEYACRGGKQQKYCGSDDVGSVAWYDDNSGNKTHPVGQKAPNAFGLYDMSGNVWEWVQDGKHGNYNNAPTDGSEWVTGASVERVLRGGSWFSYARDTRAANRNLNSPIDRDGSSGFRVARTAP